MPLEINRAPVLTMWAAVVAERLGHPAHTALTLGRAVAGSTARVNARNIGREERKADRDADRSGLWHRPIHGPGWPTSIHGDRQPHRATAPTHGPCSARHRRPVCGRRWPMLRPVARPDAGRHAFKALPQALAEVPRAAVVPNLGASEMFGKRSLDGHASNRPEFPTMDGKADKKIVGQQYGHSATVRALVVIRAAVLWSTPRRPRRGRTRPPW